MKLMTDTISSEIGEILIVAHRRAMVAVDFAGYGERLKRSLRARYGEVELKHSKDPNGYASKIRAYFAGDIDALDEIDVDIGGTPFQAKVWNELRRVRAGTTATYGEIAERVGNPKAVRAVGSTNGRNPLTLVVPCHRIIGANGTLTGYAQGLDKKRWLLAHEGAVLG